MKNRYLAALQEGYNVLGLAGLAALSAATLNPLPLLAGLVAEAAYLIFVPDSKWFEQRLARRHDAEVRAHREQVKSETLPRLRRSLQDRFWKLEAERADIERHSTGADAQWMLEINRKLDFLLEKFLQFALKDEQFRAYLYETRAEIGLSPRRNDSKNVSSMNQNGPNVNVRFDNGRLSSTAPELNDRWVQETVQLLQEAYARDVTNIETHRNAEEDESTKAVLQKRLEVLQRRRDFVARIGKIVFNLSQQLQLLEDTFGLISDELLARAPEQVLGDIEDVVSQTNSMTQVLEELAPFERMISTI